MIVPTLFCMSSVMYFIYIEHDRFFLQQLLLIIVHVYNIYFIFLYIILFTHVRVISSADKYAMAYLCSTKNLQGPATTQMPTYWKSLSRIDHALFAISCLKMCL